MAQLPNLDGLSLSGILVSAGVPPEIGPTLRGRFGGRLLLRGDYTGKNVVDMLLEVSSGMHFTEVQIYCVQGRLPSAVRLAEA